MPIHKMDVSRELKQHQATIQQFREKIKDTSLANETDVELLRWLIARNYDLARSEAMLRNSLEWRRANKVDEVPEPSNFPEVLVKYFPVGVSGTDKYGCPVWIIAYGRADLKGILYSVKRRDYINYVVAHVKRSLRLMYDNQKRLKIKETVMMQQTLIFDMYDFSMKHITHKASMETAIQLVQLYEANYPELLRRVFVINAPRIFTLAWNLLKPFLHERTKEKIAIFGSDSDAWKAAIKEEVDPSELPAFYGGTMTDPDGNPQCLTKISMGGEVPKSYYLSNTKPKGDGSGKTLNIANGTKQSLEFEVKTAGSVLRWSFYTDEGDIAFAVYRKNGANLVEIVPNERVDSHIAAEEGEIICDEPGTYVVEFDNSFSYMRSKKVVYTISTGAASNQSRD